MSTARHASTTGGWRLVRGAVVGMCASGTGALAHVFGGGAQPPLLLLTALAAAVTAVCVVVSRWRWAMPTLTAAMVLAQAGFHHVFAIVAEYGGRDAGATLHAAQMSADGPGLMALNHAVAALVIALALRFGESWLRHVLDVLGLRAWRLLRGWWSPSADGRTSAPAPRDVLVLHHPAAAVWSRGPPQ